MKPLLTTLQTSLRN